MRAYNALAYLIYILICSYRRWKMAPTQPATSGTQQQTVGSITISFLDKFWPNCLGLFCPIEVSPVT